LDGLGDQQLLTLLDNARLTLVGAHAHEVLCGFFVTGSGSITTAASVAVATVAKARIDGIEDAEIVSRHPVALALLPPRIGGQRPLPPTPEGVHAIESDETEPLATARESMRLRSRWLQELTARVALELGRRLVRRGQLRLPEDVRFLERSRLVELVHSLDIAASVGQVVVESAPLPRQFRLSPDGKIVPDTSDPGTGGPRGVSPGRARARLTHDPLDSAGAILQVGSLNPSLASLLPDLAGLIAETGSPLSHLAILAREYGVPTVVGYTGTLPQDGLVLIDGTAGTVDVVDDDGVDRPAGPAGDDVRSR
jgi:pyruvate,water dikinase